MYLVKVKFRENPDIPEGFWSPDLIWCLAYRGIFPTLQDIKEDFLKKIDEQDLGSGNFESGAILTTDGDYVGRLSYNGRIWNANNEELI